MCGIAGIFNYADPACPVDRELLVRMTRKLAHRGPDAEGFFIEDNVGLGHRRLSILDLSPSGAQPMSNDDGSCWISYNGEFYNHGEFRGRLASKGVRFHGTSDTETLLRLMEADGPDALAGMRGIFAFAFWNGRDRTLTLARDHMGVKQVYFHDDGRRIVFASEIKALLQAPGVPREADPEAVNQYLHFHTALFERTFFRDIRVLRAGEYLRIHRYGSHLRKYWSLSHFDKSDRRDAELVGELQHELTHIVGEQLMSDVPVGSFFSGGIDSCAIAAHAAKSGKKPMCFGVHFSGQGVTDERPYQEAAAKALDLDLQLITMDGSTFPEDFRRLMYHQDEPVIGAAMFPMAKVSELAARNVKVCLGGQAADEIFGGYARYTLARPFQVIRSLLTGHRSMAPGEHSQQAASQVGGNLSRQFAEGGTIYRLARNARHMLNWETSYFEHFAKVPEYSWLRVFADRDFCSRERCRQIFHESVSRSTATDPMDKIMQWDVQSYLTGLFHQDDRMSMAASLESRVPFADPRLVSFAFNLDTNLKVRGGASKWILRQAVSNVLPPLVLNRRKVGFDTPAERWMGQLHAGFVRDTLLSSRSLQRGFWKAKGLESLLAHAGATGWFDIVWKVLSIELWASIFLDEAPAQRRVETPRAIEIGGPAEHSSIPVHVRPLYVARECQELGVKGTVARALWEIKTRSGLVRLNAAAVGLPADFNFLKASRSRLPFSDPAAVGCLMRRVMTPEQADRLQHLASEATRGRILCFSRWMADFGNPIDWHRDPTNQNRWCADVHWSKVLIHKRRVGEIKFTWEAARFPQAYIMGRAAAIEPLAAPHLAAALISQIQGFLRANPPGAGVHWASGQEIALRALAWIFGLQVFSAFGLVPDDVVCEVGQNLFAAGAHIAGHIEYARDSVYNNHLLSEALGLYAAGRLLPGDEARRWRDTGFDLLVEQADRQIYSDGSYIQQSHTYHRVAMQIYLWATALMRANSEEAPKAWLKAMERSLDFLYAHQSGRDGQLSNYGSNDGSRPLLLGSDDFTDFRAILQTVSIATRGERLYEPGPWDEMSAWLFGAEVMELPLRPRARTSVSFAHSGHHVLRGNSPHSFCTFRCGTIVDRFSQMDMLHVDVWWRGQNVLVDPGSYLYNGPPRWHRHFAGTESHNTVQVDGGDQMLHFRQFKMLFPTEARLLRLEDAPEWAICEGEHYGFKREARCVHRRSVLFVKDDLWVVADTVAGEGVHQARLHWLAGDYPWAFEPSEASLRLETPEGPFTVTILDSSGNPIPSVDVVAGQDRPERGWQSRYYGEKIPVPSIAATQSGAVPVTFVTLMGAGRPRALIHAGEWEVACNGHSVRFSIEGGALRGLSVAKSVPELLA